MLSVELEMVESLFYLGHHRSPCPYLPGIDSRLLFLDGRKIKHLYRHLLDHGYRRHGTYLYRPDCLPCEECRVLRIPVNRFEESRSQRRVWKRGEERFTAHIRPARFSEEKLELYRRYLAWKHNREEKSDPEAYQEFFVESFAGSATEELHIEDRTTGSLVGVGILDRTGDALSAVYFYFEPQRAKESPGVYAILKGISLAKERGLRYYYPGYYIKDSRAMNYKIKFGPAEILTPPSGHWDSAEEFLARQKQREQKGEQQEE